MASFIVASVPRSAGRSLPGAGRASPTRSGLGLALGLLGYRFGGRDGGVDVADRAL
jgi:hypothetical protein